MKVDEKRVDHGNFPHVSSVGHHLLSPLSTNIFRDEPTFMSEPNLTNQTKTDQEVNSNASQLAELCITEAMQQLHPKLFIKNESLFRWKDKKYLFLGKNNFASLN